MEICAIRPLVDDLDVIKSMVKSKTERLAKLILFCKDKGYRMSAEYLENARPDLFTAISNRLNGKSTSRVDKVNEDSKPADKCWLMEHIGGA